MKNYKDLKKGQSVIFSFLESEFIVKSIYPATAEVVVLLGNIEKTTEVKNVFPCTEYVKNISKLIRDNMQLIKEEIPFEINIKNKLMRKAFLKHWIAMCEADEMSWVKARQNFESFISDLKMAIETIKKNLMVLGVSSLSKLVL